MTIKEAIKWIRFYANLIAINFWNGTIMYAKVAVAAGSIEAARGFDVRTVSGQTILWTWLSAVIVQIVVELNKHMLPSPTPPPQDTI